MALQTGRCCDAAPVPGAALPCRGGVSAMVKLPYGNARNVQLKGQAVKMQGPGNVPRPPISCCILVYVHVNATLLTQQHGDSPAASRL